MNDWLGGPALSQALILKNIAIAMGLGAVLGLERERLRKPAGLRTLMLVAAASALFVSMGDVVLENVDTTVAGAVLRTDPLRLLEAVVAGVSFLGAGTIIRRRHGEEVEGLTTAATMLVTAAVGACVALHQLYLAIGTTLLVFATLTVVGWIEKRIEGDGQGGDATPGE